MKTKNLLLTGIIILLGIFIFTSCNKDDESIADEPATEVETAEMVASTLASGTSGTASDIETAAALANVAVGYKSTLKSSTTNDKSLSCGESADTTIVTSAGSSLITYQNTKTYHYALECDELENPVMLDVNFSYDGTFDAPRLTSSHSVSGDFEITQIEYTSDMYLINGTWERSGGFESKIRNQANRQATIQFELVDVAVEKEPKEIDNGTMHFSISGSSELGSFSYEGTITFTGNGEAIIEISGNRYVTNLETGELEEE